MEKAKGMRRVYQIAALYFLALSAFVVWESLELEYYTNLGPGPGFFPLWLAVILGGLSLVWLLQFSAEKGRSSEGNIVPDRTGLWRIIAILAGLAVTAGFMDLVGFQITMFLFLIFLLRVLGRQALWASLVIAVLGSVGVYYLFGGYLDVPLPAASWKFLSGLGL